MVYGPLAVQMMKSCFNLIIIVVFVTGLNCHLTFFIDGISFAGGIDCTAEKFKWLSIVGSSDDAMMG